MTIALAGLSLVIWVGLWTLHGRFWSAGPILARSQQTATPAVTVIIPARDEASTIAAALRSILAQDYAGPMQVVVIDDRSTDGTGAIARSVADPRLLVIDGAPRPEGWSGKLWAIHQGVAAAVADPVVLFADADILHSEDHLSSLMSKMQRDGLDLVSEMVALNCSSAAERWLVPAFVFFFQLLYPFAAVNDPSRRTAAAAGGTMLVRADALMRIGGIGAIRGALIDDVTLATRIKRTGGGIWLGHSARAWSLRPYPSATDVWRMVARTAFVQLRFSWPLVGCCTLGMALIWLVPPWTTLFGQGAARWIGLAAWIAASSSYVPTVRRFGLSPWRAPLLPAVAAFYMAATIGSAFDHLRGRGVRWKDRSYTGGAIKQTVR